MPPLLYMQERRSIKRDQKADPFSHLSLPLLKLWDLSKRRRWSSCFSVLAAHASASWSPRREKPKWKKWRKRKEPRKKRKRKKPRKIRRSEMQDGNFVCSLGFSFAFPDSHSPSSPKHSQVVSTLYFLVHLAFRNLQMYHIHEEWIKNISDFQSSLFVSYWYIYTFWLAPKSVSQKV